MKAIELYNLSKMIMFEKSTSKDYDNYYIANINILLRENFDLNNNLLEVQGKEILKQVPYVTSPNDEIKYVDDLTNFVLPYGLAANFLRDDDMSKKSDFYTQYLNAIIQVSPLVPRKTNGVM